MNFLVPLLDQPAIIEGTRSRKCIQKPEPVEVKPGSIVIPEGKGKPLGKIPLVNSRLSVICNEITQRLD